MRRTGQLAIALMAAGVLVGGAIDAFSTPVTDCDNVAGECLRTRQTAAIYGVGALCVVAAVAVVWAAAGVLRAGRATRVGAIVVVAGVVFAVGMVAIRPADRLDNRFDGWLSAATQQAP